ncbi:CPBP family intramembrane glutamic endopeptidase [Bradyrhizobium sp. S69]|uniref:CPBP family intramembrane glutamic endopeptidase n=1 Tax=Bradyrhizobium sp. S69 TaxID=1641856 RepID=UPI001FEFF2CC|nr:CPBP family intramembrane glutamic endopeptidase [Bradyrhizobium sp. S69]
MSNVKKAGPRVPVSSSPLRTWDFFETTLVALIAYGVLTETGWYAAIFAFKAYGSFEAYSPAELRAAWLRLHGTWQGAGSIVAVLPTIAVLWVAIRMAGRGFVEYLALNWPTPRETAVAFGVMSIVMVGESLLGYLVGAKSGVTHSHLAVLGPSGLMIMLIGSCIAAPVAEEFLVRGFMFRGWSQSFPGATGAIVLTSAAWAMNHTQYDWFLQLKIFGEGVVLAYFRWRTASTWLTIMIHSAINTFVFLPIGSYV